jgi:hypothetical protein
VVRFQDIVGRPALATAKLLNLQLIYTLGIKVTQIIIVFCINLNKIQILAKMKGE